jgi:hypothetical protein
MKGIESPCLLVFEASTTFVRDETARLFETCPRRFPAMTLERRDDVKVEYRRHRLSSGTCSGSDLSRVSSRLYCLRFAELSPCRVAFAHGRVLWAESVYLRSSKRTRRLLFALFGHIEGERERRVRSDVGRR